MHRSPAGSSSSSSSSSSSLSPSNNNNNNHNNTRCRVEDRAAQLKAVASQRERLFGPLREKRWKVELFLATTDWCGPQWQKKLEASYGPYLKASHFTTATDVAGTAAAAAAAAAAAVDERGIIAPAALLKRVLSLYDTSERSSKSRDERYRRQKRQSTRVRGQNALLLGTAAVAAREGLAGPASQRPFEMVLLTRRPAAAQARPVPSARS